MRARSIPFALVLSAVCGCTCGPAVTTQRFACRIDAECAEGNRCTAGVCLAASCAPVESQCSDGQDDDCDGLTDCADSDCTCGPSPNDGGGGGAGGGGGGGGGSATLPLGSACAAGGQCASGFCADSVCCSSACAGPCESCARFGLRGTCLPEPAGTSEPACAPYTCSATGGCSNRCNQNPCAPGFSCSSNWRCLPRLSQLRDDFSGGLDGGPWMPYRCCGPGAQVDVRAGGVQVDLGARDAGYAGVYTAAVYDGRDGGLSVRVVNAGNQSLQSFEVIVWVGKDFQNTVGFGVQRAQLLALTHVGGTTTSLTSVAYSPAQVQLVRLREQRGELHWEFSDGGGSFVSLARTAAPFSFEEVFVELSAGYWSPQTSSSTVVFDDVAGE